MGHAVVSAFWAVAQINLVMVSRALSNTPSNVVVTMKILLIDNAHRLAFKIVLIGCAIS